MNAYLEKLPRSTLYILLILVIAFVSVAFLIWQNVQGANSKLTLDGQLAIATLTLQNTSQAANVDAVQAELTAAEAQLKDNMFPQQPPSVELVGVLVRAAKESGVELGNLQVTSIEQEKVGAGSYNVMRQRLQFRGTPNQLAGFFSRVEKGGFKSLIMNNVSLSPKGSVWEGRMDLYLYSSP